MSTLADTSGRTDSASPSELHEHPIVFYDGDCALCNAFVQWLIARDRRRVFRFASLQGETASQTIGKPSGEPEQWTVILLDIDGTHERSDAVLRIMRHLGGVWRFVGVFRVVPRALRDAMYRFIARHRFRWFGKATCCRVPSDEQSRQLLP